MVKLSKRPLPNGITITSDDDYRSGAVFNTLVEDCHGKCYLCEDMPTNINVEHIVPHRSDTTLRYDWNNLLLACGHCNSIKGAKYDDIINPTITDPEVCIALSIDFSDDLVEHVGIIALNHDSATLNTAELLGYVYNGGSTPMKAVESANLRNEHLLPNIQRFIKYIKGYLEEPDIGYADIIKKEIRRSSKFAAFKRKIIRDNSQLVATFSETLMEI